MSTVLDGNAVAAALFQAFGFEVTAALCECGSCGARFRLAEATAYPHAPGTVVRCRGCTSVLIVLATIRETTCVDCRGLARMDPA